MKKTFLALLLVFVFAFAVSACAKTPADDTQDSSVISETESADTSSDKSEESNSQPSQDPVITDENLPYKISAEEFAAALDAEAFYNATIKKDAPMIVDFMGYTMDLGSNFVYKIDNFERVSVYSKGILGTTDKIITCIDGEYYKFEKPSENEKYIKIAIDEDDFESEIEGLFNGEMLTLLAEVYDQLSFDEETCSYVGENVSVHPEYYDEPVVLKTLTVKFDNGALTELVYTREDNGTPERCTYVVTDRGTTKVDVPEEDDFVEACEIRFDTNGYYYGYVNLSSVTVGKGSKYSVNDKTITIGIHPAEATPEDGHIFEGWFINGEKLEDGVYVFESDAVIIAVFKPEGEYNTVNFVSENPDHGFVDTEVVYVATGTNYSVSGDQITAGEITVVAIAENGYVFDKWTANGSELPEEGVIPGDCTITANFVKFEPDPDLYYVIFIEEDVEPAILSAEYALTEDGENAGEFVIECAYFFEDSTIRIYSGSMSPCDFDETDAATAAAADFDADGNAVVKADGYYKISFKGGKGYIEELADPFDAEDF